MSPLLRTALATLLDSVAAPGLRAVACSTLLAALDNALEVPPGSYMACWRHLLGSDQSAARLHHHELAHPDVANDAVRVLLDLETGETAQDLAMAVLRGPNVSVITNDDLTTIADRVLNEGRCRRVIYLIEQVHEHRGLDPAFLISVRDRLAASDDASVRAAAVEVGGLLPRLDAAFTGRMFSDGSALVRAAVAESLHEVEHLDRNVALRLIRDRLDHETHRGVLSACYSALATLIRRSPGRGKEN